FLKRRFKSNNNGKKGVRRNSDESGLDLKHVLHDIFNITKEIEDIKEKLKHYDKKLDTTNKDVSVEKSKNVTLKSKYLLTIFSTWTESEDRLHIYNNTLRNWASFKPIFNPVLFTNDTTLAKHAQKYGWKVLPLIKVADNGLPILKYMYIAAINAFSSTFYCYANSDILFEDGLVKTLVNLEYALGAETLDSTPVFLTGLRLECNQCSWR
ncbi:uncharacterized protein LOC132717695, partial [Ruditapes philippinarum]|uniref:uncharacterized protein LOC132717695 n=1 Tax=Ruditapes philippinarum TaxID=129788 RepID=UPI00295B4B07